MYKEFGVTNFTELCSALKLRLGRPLPGEKAHELFRARPVGDIRPLIDHKDPPRPGGVLLLLYEDQGIVKFPLIKRPEYTGAHSGQVSLPGGKSEPGEDAFQTALRECEEEIGVAPHAVRIIGRLSDFYVIPSNYIVTPVVASVAVKPVFRPDPHEVARIIEGRLADIAAEDAMKEKEIIAAGKYRMMAPHFEVENEVVWGATAMMLNEFRTVLRDLS